MARLMKQSGIEWLGDIPAHWKRDKVSRIFQTIGSGTTPKSENPDYYNGDVHWIQSGDINGGFLTDTKISVTVEAVKKFSALRIYDAPFIVVAMYGASIGNLSLSHINACVNQACCVMRGGQQHIEYHFYALKVAKDYLVWKAVGGGQPNISQDTVKQLWLPVPPLDEQQRIAAYLDDKCGRIDSVIAKTVAAVAEYKKLKQAIITRVVTRGIRANRTLQHSGIDWLGDIPDDWTTPKFSAICSVITDYVASGSFASLAENVKYLDEPDYAMLVRTADVSNKGYNPKPVYTSTVSDFLCFRVARWRRGAT